MPDKPSHGPIAFFYWTYYNDGRVETNFTSDLQSIVKQGELVEELPPTIPPKPIYKQLTCKRCNYTWIPRSRKKPVQCPKCRSPYWAKERKNKRSSVTENPSGSL